MAIAYNSNYHGTMPFSDTCLQINLATSTDKTFTVPGVSGTRYSAIFSYASNSNVFVRLNGVPTIPAAGNSSTEQYSEFKPARRYVNAGDIIHFITPDAAGAYCGMSLRQIS